MQIGTVHPVRIDEEMERSYLDYAMSVIVARALPDVRDGLKPVQRRILYAMNELGLRHTAAYKKSARIVGEVLGKYHPHGDASVYEAMVRMAQDFSMRYPLVDGQGNFGSVDDDPPAAMRYTEARLAEIAGELLADIDKATVDFTPNFDGSLEEPTVLPSRIPQLLINGSAGIAVGMATSIPPHNLGEICDAIVQLIDNPEATVEDLCHIVQGPDFPTGAFVMGRQGIKEAYSTGHGRAVLRARAQIEEMGKGRRQIIVTELPYQTNKAALVEKIASLAREKKIGGIADLRDESDREGMRIVIELRREATPELVLNNLYEHTALQQAFPINLLALVDGQPRVISLKAALQHFSHFRRQVVERRSRYDLGKARDRAHILEGLKMALDHLDEIITTIRRAPNAETARNNLMTNFGLSQAQAQAILDLQLRRLAALERQKILEEYTEVLKTLAYLEDLLANPPKILYLIKEEAQEVKAKYGDSRRTEIREEELKAFVQEDLIPHQEMVITLSQRGYAKRIASDTYRLQRRGGRGVSGMATREADAVQHLIVADTHDDLLFFTNRGKVYRLKCYELSGDSSRQSRGVPLINLISLDPNEQVTAMIAVGSLNQEGYLVMATRLGRVKKTFIREFASVRANGLIAVRLKEKDELISAKLVSEGEELLLASEKGKALRVGEERIPAHSRNSGGVRGLRLAKDDRLVTMEIATPGTQVLTLSTLGFGKRTPLKAYPRHHRGTSGVLSMRVTEKTGPVAAVRVVTPGQELHIISAEGIVIRTSVDEVSVIGRVSQGVRVMRLEPGDRVVSLASHIGSETNRPASPPREKREAEK